MVHEIHVEGYDAFKNTIKGFKNKTVFILFSGSKTELGESWCPDCVKAEPIINQNMQYAPIDSVLIHCSVGERDVWKDQGNSFRKDPSLYLKCVPTLLKLGSPNRLEEEQCKDNHLVKMLFEDD